MPRFRVHLNTVASASVEVEADDAEAAIEKVFDGNLPYAPGFANYDFGEWSLVSEFDRQNGKPEDDVTELGDSE